MENVETLRRKYEELIRKARAQADAWRGKEDEMPPEVAAEIDRLLGQADELKARIELLGRMEGHRQFMEEPQGTRAAHMVATDWRPAGPWEGMPQVDPQAWRELEVKVKLPTPAGALEETKVIRYYVPLAVQAKGYASAFEAYLRKGIHDIGPNDRKTLTEGVDTAGGFLVPEDFQAQVIRKVAAQAIVRNLARRITTSRDAVKWPRVVYTADDKYTSGVRLTWTGESPASATTHRVTEPVFGIVNIPVHTAMASMPVSNDLIEDAAFDVLGVAGDLLTEAFALGEDDAFINGNGVARPKGILTDVDTADGPASVPSGSASGLTADGLVDLIFALPSQYERNARVLMNKATEKEIRKLKDANNNYIWPVWPSGGGFAPSPREILGFPVLRDEFVPDVAAGAYPIIFGDLSGYVVVDRVGLSIQRLAELYAETNVVLLLARRRVGGQLVEPYRVKVQKVGT